MLIPLFRLLGGQVGKLVFLLGWLFMGFSVAWGQDFERWREQDGLPNRYVNHGLQTRDGFIWLATDGGLVRFDGYSFEPILDPNTKLPLLGVSALLEEGNTLWVGSQSGIQRLDLTTYQLRTIGLPKELEGKPFTKLMANPSGGVFALSSLGDLVQVADTALGLGTFGPKTTFATAADTLWVRDAQGACHRAALGTEPLQFLAPVWSPPDALIGSISALPSVGIVTWGAKGAWQWQGERKGFVRIYETLEGPLFWAHEDYQGRVWVIGKDRKALHVWQQGALQTLTDHFFDPYENIHINYFFEDRSRNLWICTNSGLYKVANAQTRFRFILAGSQYSRPEYIPSFRGMWEDTNGDLYIGGYSGLFRVSPEGAIEEVFDNQVAYSPYTILPADEDHLWVVSEGYNLLEVNKATGVLRKVSVGPEVPPFMKAGLRTSDSTLWLGGMDGLWNFHEPSERFYPQPLVWEGEEFTRASINHLYTTADGHHWISTDQGLFETAVSGVVLRRFTSGDGAGDLGSSVVNSVVEDAQGRLWICLSGAGVQVLDRGTGRLTSYTVLEGLADNTVAFGLEGKDGRLWFGTNHGVSAIDPATGGIQNYYTLDGLSHNEFNKASYLRTRDGRLLMGGVNGINELLEYDKKADTSFSVPLLVSRVEVRRSTDSVSRRIAPADLIDEIRLPTQLSYLTVDFALADYSKSDQNRYAYQLAGYDDAWVSLGNAHSMRLAALPHGHYTLNLRSTGAKGNREMATTSLRFFVPQVFYKSWWFITMVSLFLMGLVAGYLYLRLKRQRDLANMRIDIAGDLHDDVGSALVRMALKTEMLEEVVPEPWNRELETVTATSRSVLGSMRDLVWSMDSQTGTYADLYQKLREFTQQQFADSDLAVELRLADALTSQELLPRTKKELFFILKESLTNALKHSNGDQIYVSVVLKGNAMLWKVHDNGTQTDADGTSAGIGLRNMQKRAERIGSHLEVVRQDGFLVQLNVPLS